MPHLTDDKRMDGWISRMGKGRGEPTGLKMVQMEWQIGESEEREENVGHHGCAYCPAKSVSKECIGWTASECDWKT